MENGNKGMEELKALLEETTLPGQRDAITAEDPLVVVSAGAGTGKTWTLAWRFVWAIATGRASIPEILTLTFTEKAALEMKERIRTILGETASKIPSLSPILLEAMSRMDESYVSTIHSFCMRVIKEGGLSLDLDPDSRPTTTPDEEDFWREAKAGLDHLDGTWFSKHLPGTWIPRGKELLASPLLMDIVNTYGAVNVTALSRGISSMWASRGETAQDLWTISDDLERTDEEALYRLGRIYLPVLGEEWQRWIGGDGIIPNLASLHESKTKLAERLTGLQHKWGGEMPADEELPLFFADLMEATKRASGKMGTEIADILGSSVTDYRKERGDILSLCSIMSGGIDERDRKVRRELLRISAIMWQAWEMYKGNKGLLSFDDMISDAIEALRSGDMGTRFREVMIDEFQDTDRLQDRLLKIIKDKGEPRLFLVGDLKQSIYGFRHADPLLFGEYIDKAKSGEGRYINLDVSFRSSAKVLGALNSIFSRIWEKGLGKELAHLYEPLKSPVHADWHSERQKVGTPPLEVMVEYYQTEGEKVSADDKRLDLTRRLGSRLVEMKEAGAPIWDKKEMALRPLRWSDMAVLVPTRNQYGALEKAFTEDMSIPCYFESNLGYYSRSEVQDLLSLINYLAYPDDDVACASFLSSPFSGLSLEETSNLLEYARLVDGNGMTLGEAVHEKYPDLADRLERWRRIASMEGVSKVLALVLEQGDILMAFPFWKRRKAAANLRKTIDITREYENIIGKNIGGCAEYLGESMGSGIAMEDADSTGEKEDVVRIMTTHASKGLEFSIIAVMGMEYVQRRRSPGTSLSPSSILGAAISKYPEDMADGSADKPQSPLISQMFEKQEQIEEWQRLFYVAATRARDSIILCGTLEGKEGERPTPKEGSWLSMIWEWDFPEIRLLTERVSEKKKQEKEVEGTRVKDVEKPAGTGERIARLSATSYSLFKYCPLAWRMRHRQGRDLKWELPGEDGPGGADLGSLAHWVLRKWDFRVETINDFLPGEEDAERDSKIGIEAYLLPEWRKAGSRKVLYSWLERLAASETGKELRTQFENGNLRREVPFRIKMEGGPLLTGSMDVFWETEKGVKIRDYKITAIDRAPEELYASQLRFYGWTWYLAFGRPDSEIDMKLIHLREGIETEEITLPTGGLEKIGEDIRMVAGLAAHGPFKPEKSKCRHCPFRRDCCLYYDSDYKRK